jgi:hypothetical protein
MAMFSRRNLQQMLDALAAHIPVEARRKLARELDRRNTSALGFEWETAILFALSHVGQIEYEASAVDGPRPDIGFREAGGGSICFTADVATVSDSGLEADNPAMRFSLALHRLRKKYKLPGVLNFDIKGEATGPAHRDRKMRLKLPPQAGLDSFLGATLGPELQRIQREELDHATMAVNEPGIEFTVNYHANQRLSSGHYPSFTATYSLTRNPVYRTLRDKARQLKKFGGPHPCGIFLCDGNCALLKSTQTAAVAFGLRNVIEEFFRQNSSISFVAILKFPPTRQDIFTGLIKELRISGELYPNPRAAKPLEPDPLLALINRGLAHLPSPAATPHDALHFIGHAEAHEGNTINVITHGGNLMSQAVKLSARKIQELLAGKITAEQLFSDYQHPDSKFENPFLSGLKSGLTMESASVTRVPDADDDVMEIRFGPPDPAIKKFTVSR